MAVPFEACDQPKTRAEYKDPDVAITLTFLAYYQTGLSPAQLREMVAALDALQPSARARKFRCGFFQR